MTKYFLKKLKTGNFCDFTRFFGLVSLIFFLAIFGFFSPILANSAASNKINLELILVESTSILSSSSQVFSSDFSSISFNNSTNISTNSSNNLQNNSPIQIVNNSQNTVYSMSSNQNSQNNNPLDYVQNTIRTGGFGFNWFLSALVILTLLIFILLRSKLKIQIISKQIISKNPKNQDK